MRPRWLIIPALGLLIGITRLYTEGDPHLRTVDGANYDFQSANEFVLLRDDTFEVQARQSAVETDGPLPPNGYTGLSSCVSLNTAAAVRVGPHRVTYQPDTTRVSDANGLQLRIDGKLTNFDGPEIRLPSGGRILRTQTQGGIQIESSGGAIVVITPNWWDYYRVWYLNINIDRARATQGVIGAIPPGNWLPALPDGSSMGPLPGDLHQRYLDLYEKFEGAWRGGKLYALLVALIALVLFAVLVLIGLSKRPVLLSLMALLILIGIVIALQFGKTNMRGSLLTKTVAHTNAGLAFESGKSYFWKVVVEDGKGGSAESETRRFVAR